MSTQSNGATVTNQYGCYAKKPDTELYVPRVLWTWDVFGGGLMIVKLSFNVPLWRRVLCRVFLGSTFVDERAKGAKT